MAVSKPVIVGGIGGGGAIVAGGTYIALNKKGETIWDKVKDYALETSEDFTKAWTAKTTKENKPQGVTSEGSLQNWCKNQYSKPHDTKEENTSKLLIDKVNEWCTFTVKQKLEETSRHLDVTGNTDENTLTSLLTKLKDNKQKDTSLETKFSALANKTPSAATNTELKTLCKESYDSPFTGENKLWHSVDTYCAKETILSKLNGTELPTNDDLNSDWDKKVTEAIKTESGKGTNDSALKSSLTQVSDTKKKREELQKWCKEQYPKAEDKKITSSGNDKTIDDVKKFCALTIKEKLNENTTKGAINENNGDADWKTRAKELNVYSPNNTEPKLSTDLESVKKSDDTDGSKAKDGLKEWCKSTYEKGYKGEKDELWLLASKFCRKP